MMDKYTESEELKFENEKIYKGLLYYKHYRNIALPCKLSTGQ